MIKAVRCMLVTLLPVLCTAVTLAPAGAPAPGESAHSGVPAVSAFAVCVAQGDPCNDDNPCTTGDACDVNGVCVGTPIKCTASDKCHVAGTCDPATGVCSNPNATNGVVCDDDNVCTKDDKCKEGVCVGKPGSDGVLCDDGNLCTQADACLAGVCVGTKAADGTACEDNDGCTRTDSCRDGLCVGGDPVVCPAPAQCRLAGTCDPLTGTCSSPSVADGTPCNDGNACTLDDRCLSGTCGPAPSFAPSANSPVSAGSHPYSVAVGDFNRDGTSDLAVAEWNSGAVTILLGNGSGGFAEAAGSPVGVGQRPFAVAVGDFNLDGKPDIVAANQGSNTVSILLGNGMGGFAAAAGSPVGVGNAPASVAVSDLNLDGKPDVVVVNRGSDTMTILLGNGSGGFVEAAGSPIGTGKTPASVAVGDFNLDGRPDIAVANRGSGTMTILLGNGLGGFSEAAGSPVGTGSSPVSAAVGDFNLDGRVDLVVANYAAQSLTVLLGNGSGGFSPAEGPPVGLSAAPLSVAVGDFDLDGRQDLAVTRWDFKVSVLRGNGSGGFAEAAGSPLRTGNTPASVAVGDFNRDGKPDLVVANELSDSLTVLLNASSIVICPAEGACREGLCDPATGVCTTAPVPDGAGCDDGNLCTANDACRGGGCAGAPVSCTAIDPCHVAGTCSPAGGCSNPAAVDGTVCSDGNVCTTADQCVNGSCTGAPAPNGTVCDDGSVCTQADTCLNGRCGGSPAPDGTTCSDNNACTRSDACRNGVCVGGDPIVCAAPDVCHLAGTCNPATGACSSPSAAEGTVCDDGNACTLEDRCRSGICGSAVSFTPIAGPTTGARPYALATGDFNLDGKPDLVVSSPGSSTVTILLGDASGHFTEAPGSPITFGRGPSSVAVADFNKDGRPDLAVATFASNVRILLGNGLGGFTEAAGSPVQGGGYPGSLATGDFNLDGSPDLAVTNYGSRSVTILLGDGSGGFVEAAGSPVGAGDTPRWLVVGDFNLDGTADLAVASLGSSRVTVLLGKGTGGFAEAGGSPIVLPAPPVSVVAGDFNLDGRPDLALATTTEQVVILLGNGSGRFAAGAGSPVGVGKSPTAIAVGDFNLDGTPDLAVSNSFTNDVTILVGDGSGGFSEAAGSPHKAGDFPQSILAGDFNLDGVPDLAVVGATGGAVTLLLGSAGVVSCPPGDSCHASVCDPHSGVCGTDPAPNGAVCSNGIPCTTNGECSSGSCTQGPAVVCAASDQCHVAGTCDPATDLCSNPAAADGTPCDDSDLCTQTDACAQGVCVGSNRLSGCQSDALPLTPAEGAQIFADPEAQTFTWSKGIHTLFRPEWSSTDNFAKGKTVTSGGWRSNSDIFVPPSSLWTQILKLGVPDGTIRWRISVKDGKTVTSSPLSRIILADPQPAAILAPSAGSSFSASAPPPVFSWDANHNATFRILYSAFQDFHASKIVLGGSYTLKGPTFTPSVSQWKNIYNTIAKNSPGGVVYFAVEAKDAIGRTTRSAVGDFNMTP